MKKDLLKTWREYRSFAVFIVLMVVFRSALADWNVVPTGSMKPTILEGDRILVNKLAYDFKIPLTHISLYRFADPRRGDIVVFDSEAADTRLVKRVIGMPGDTVEMRDNHLTINGIAARYSDIQYDADTTFAIESYLDMSHPIELTRSEVSRFRTFGPVTVPKDRYLVLGDNRDNSADSRFYGFVPREEIIGSTKTIVLSLNYDDHYIPRADRFFHPL